MNKYLFSLKDTLGMAMTYDNPDYNHYENTSSLLLKLGSSFTTYTSKVYNEEGVSQTGIYKLLEELNLVKWTNNHYVLNDYLKEFLDILSSRLSNEFCIITNDLEASTLQKEVREFLDKLISLLSLTYPKYKELLDSYEKAKGKLLDALEDSYVDYENITEEQENSQNRNRESSSNNSSEANSFSNRNTQQSDSKASSNEGKSHINDTPQNRDSGNYGNEDYASQIEFAESEANESLTSEGHEGNLTASNEEGSSNTEDNESISSNSTNLRNKGLYHISQQQRDALIERLELISKNYQNVLERWTKEFYPLCWERGTYE